MGILSPKSYATERWANAVVKVVTSPEDTRTIEHWGRLVGASRATLATWCRSARVSPRRSLQLARLLRALSVTHGNLNELQDAMDIVEPRTMKRLLGRAGVLDGSASTQAGTRDFLRHQSLVPQQKALAVLESVLDDHRVFSAISEQTARAD
jgi:hypothetical protein